MRATRWIVFATALVVAVLCVEPPAWLQPPEPIRDALSMGPRQAYARTWADMAPENIHPPVALPLRPGDRLRYPRANFSILYVTRTGFAVDTRASTVTQDRVRDPDTTIHVQFTRAQLDTLYERALRDRLFDMPDSPPLPTVTSLGDGDLTIRAGGKSNTLHEGSWTLSATWSDGHKRVRAYVLLIKRLVESMPAYHALPPPRGRYMD